MVGRAESTAFHTNTGPNGQELDVKEREQLFRPYLPQPPIAPYSPSRVPFQRQKVPPKGRRRKLIRNFLKSRFHLLVYFIIHAIFSVYIRFRTAYHVTVNQLIAPFRYHWRTPQYIQRDVSSLEQVPRHLSVILELNRNDRDGSGLESLVHDVGQIAAWCASAEIPFLSVYERTGILKSKNAHTYEAIANTLQNYFGDSPNRPTLSVRAPNFPSFSPPQTPPTSAEGELVPDEEASDEIGPFLPHLTVLLISAEDGRTTLVDLTKTLAEMSQDDKLFPDEITAEVIDAEIRGHVMDEPDLLILFSPKIVLDGYPPWQLRLTEIFHSPDNSGVSYIVFGRALRKYGKAQMRFGR
ncbi:Undecaprenyl diphosphate synthase [Patellaria atrata CBS 101060]|uniref:ditrans,polycis-polyprenyl diphosphate synthase [(2E,6E)-farnesyldiphosphate specific] n=1 Tax=Patellaria atrata CBS 101060 TaxID=1346257 RepID=A0A9P4VME0_9PEZI|nr:Undecaprenyl diphosphate synthase [Patellaria atrata CBS 101060]